MEANIFDKIQEIDLKKTMESSYIDYAMSVIASRAIPDVRDGLKPVQRRILFSMIELNNGPDKPHRKCARIVGDTMGKYHPHGDVSIYDALVKLAQGFATRYPLVDGHGNFGSVDGDDAAAMRYTEARLSRISMEMLADINKNTVDFVPNFDDTEKEPSVLPSRFPNLLVNGTSGIAVGMATNIPPHNLHEIIQGCVKMIDNRILEDRDTDIEELLPIIKGPDFPTGAEIVGVRGIEEAYRTGRGKIRVRAVTNIETMDNGKSRIIVTELPFMVNKAALIAKIADLVKEKRVDGITALTDESSREGMRINIELRRDANPNVILNQLMKHTQLMDTFGVNMLTLVNNEPKTLNLHDMLYYYLQHQEDVVYRRTQYDLNKALERAHILEGLLIALDHIDEVIAIIRGSENVQAAKTKLMERFGLSDAQAQAIVDMRLRALTGLEREKLEEEYRQLQERITELKAILADKKLLLGVIKEELMIIDVKYSDPRRTVISFDEDEFDAEDLIADEPTVVAMTSLGYIKRMELDAFRSQNRGGRGIRGMQTIENDTLEDLFMARTHSDILFFTNQGRVYRLKCYEIPEASRTSRGVALVNLLLLQPEEKVTATIVRRDADRIRYLMMGTKNGIIKKTPVREFANIRKNGLRAINLREGDELIEVKATDGEEDVFLVTAGGKCARFTERAIRPMGRAASGVKGIRLREGDAVIGMQTSGQGSMMLFITEKGLGKRTPAEQFPCKGRHTQGVKAFNVSEKSGNIMAAKLIGDGQEIMLITTEGILIRTSADEISVRGRAASGVKVINLSSEEERVASIAKVRDLDPETDIPEPETDEEEPYEEEELYDDGDIPEDEDDAVDEEDEEEDLPDEEDPEE